MKICVVGGTGNISTSIVKLLLQQGHEVTVFNRGKSGEVPQGVRALHGDRSEREKFESAMQAEKFDAAIDMICFTEDDAKSSVRAFRGVSHFVHCSTVCTYGIDYDWFPTTEDHLLRPTTDYGRNKVAADNVFLEAFHGSSFPVTIIKPSTTYGPQMGLLRQIAWEFAWIDRVRRGKPIVVSGDGLALTQFLHVDDAAPAFCGVIGKPVCLGQTYNMMKREVETWNSYHRTAMKVLGREVEIVGVPLDSLRKAGVPNFSICDEIFAYNIYYSPEKLMRDVPEFRPQISLEAGMQNVLEAMDKTGRVPNSDDETWEDEIIEKQRRAFD